MAQCAYSKTETFFYDGGVPICLECADARDANRKPPETEHRIRTILMRDLLQATARSKAAGMPFEIASTPVMAVRTVSKARRGRNIPTGAAASPPDSSGLPGQ